jgi:hypothetical protein
MVVALVVLTRTQRVATSLLLIDNVNKVFKRVIINVPWLTLTYLCIQLEVVVSWSKKHGHDMFVYHVT